MPDVHLPQYYRETFFSGDSLLQADASGGNYGIEGNAILQNLHGDDVITTLLLCSFILAVIAFSKTTGFMLWQLRNFFYLPHEGRSEVKETTSEVRSLCYLILLSSTVISLLYYFHTMQIEGESFLLDSPYQLLAVFLVCVLVFFCLKYVLYLWVNSVFFGGKRNVHWMRSYIFLFILEGILMSPLLFAQLYFDLSIKTTEIYFIIVLIIVKILTFYRYYLIFFRQNVVGVQIILYLCALEIVPLIALWAGMDITANSLKINY